MDEEWDEYMHDQDTRRYDLHVEILDMWRTYKDLRRRAWKTTDRECREELEREAEYVLAGIRERQRLGED